MGHFSNQFTVGLEPQPQVTMLTIGPTLFDIVDLAQEMATP